MARFVIFSFDRPYPANRGGRADVWRRILGLRQLGHDVLLVAWIYGRNNNENDLAVIKGVVSEYFEYPVRSGLIEYVRRLFCLPFLPSHVSSRMLDQRQRSHLDRQIGSFRPDYIWCEGPYPGWEAMRTAKIFDVPLAYRSHNIEHQYMARQAAVANSLRDKLAWKVAAFGLKRFELKIMAQAELVLDISLSDKEFWRRLGISRIAWLPPLPESMIQHHCGDNLKVPDVDVVFLGNLTTPNNVAGVRWLLDEVKPILDIKRPGVKFLIGGSNPTQAIIEALARHPEVLQDINPVDAVAVYLRGRTLVNPVRTGSGIQLKVVEMLALGTPVVTTLQGTAGMPEDVKTFFRISDDAEEFASSILEALDAHESGIHQRQAQVEVARQYFGLPALEAAISRL